MTSKKECGSLHEFMISVIGLGLATCEKPPGHVSLGDNWHQDGNVRWDDAEAIRRTFRFEIVTDKLEAHA